MNSNWRWPDGPAIVVWIGVLGSISSVVALALAVHLSGFTWIAVGLILPILVLVLLLFWRLVFRLWDALAITLTWGEAIHQGVRWGWTCAERDRVLGPYCPDPAHGDRLRVRGTGLEATDGDVVGPGNALYCPQEPNRDYLFTGSALSGISVGLARERVRRALATIGVWRTISA